MRPPLLDAVRGRVLLGDGAMGTQLLAAGLATGHSGDEWNLSAPEKVAAIHSAYVAAGSEILLTNTFQASAPALGRYGWGEKAYDINLRGARIARDCIGSRGYVLGDLGPFGGYLAPLGNMSRERLEGAFAEQSAGLLDGGVDGIIIETMTALEEVEAAIVAIRGVRHGAPLVASITFDRLADGGFRTMTGATVSDVVGLMTRLDVDILGCNCGTGLHIGDYVQLVAEYRSLSDRPIMVQPNAGQPRLDRARIVYDETPETMAAGIARLLEAGASIIGGCCGTTPEHIRLFRQELDRAHAAPGRAAKPGVRKVG